MAIDFMVMPLSRYLTGDFITPSMRWSWDSGVPYFVMGPDGKGVVKPPTTPRAKAHRPVSLMVDP